MGLLEVVEDRGTGFTLALDGVEPLLKAERRLWSHLEELVESAGSRGLPFRLVLTSRDPGVLTEMERREGPLARPDLVLPLPRLPYRVAGWAHGSRTPSEAFLHWALLGDEPGHLPPRRNKHVSASGPVSEGRAGTKESGGPTASWAGVKSAVARRVLDPGGDLFDAPLNHLEITFQRPARYATILRALAPAPRDWSGVLERAQGVEGGGQLAPYLRRLEEEGLVQRQLPLDADPESRKRRYSVADPFHAFWFRFVLPLRSVLPTSDVEELWDRAIAPGLDAYLQRWLEEAARRWLREHAAETFGVPARTVGALWGGEAPFPLAGRLANGQVCYGLVDWTGTEDDLPGEMKRRMKATRYGIGRAARAPLFFLRRATPDEEVGGEQEELRRTLARDPLARLVGLEELMGSGPPSEAGP